LFPETVFAKRTSVGFAEENFRFDLDTVALIVFADEYKRGIEMTMDFEVEGALKLWIV
jgi:hypothetical protein